MRLDGAGLACNDSQPGFSGLDAEVEADQDGGHLRLNQAQLQVRLPDVFEQPLPVGALSGDFAWKPAVPICVRSPHSATNTTTKTVHSALQKPAWRACAASASA